MDVYILDSLLRRESIVDMFDSFIWTERFSAWGDFELKIEATVGTRAMFKLGTKLAILESYRVMTVESIENGVSAQGQSMLTIKGRSLEALLEDRMIKAETYDDWKFNADPASALRIAFNYMAGPDALRVLDKIPFIHNGRLVAESTIPEPVDPVSWVVPIQSLYKFMTDVCSTYELGFRISRDGDQSGLYFDVYSGNDRSSKQFVKPLVLFAPELDNLQNTRELTSDSNYKTVAYVLGERKIPGVGGAEDTVEVVPVEVFAEFEDPDSSGFERRVLVVDAKDVKEEDAIAAGITFNQALIQKGVEELAKHRSLHAFDGEMDQNERYRYGVDYDLGDLIDVRGTSGVISRMRVTEQVFVSDAQGDRMYPTVTLNQLIEAGSWLSQNFRVWEDYKIDEFWETMP